MLRSVYRLALSRVRRRTPLPLLPPAVLPLVRPVAIWMKRDFSDISGGHWTPPSAKKAAKMADAEAREAGVRTEATEAAEATGAATAPTIALTDSEQQLRTLLVHVAAYVDQSEARRAAQAEPVVLRWAGGWVRDRLLGRPSEDIDTAIDSMTGFAFAQQMQAYRDSQDKDGNGDRQAVDMGSLHKIEANPEKSKHLETATVRLGGFDVDFVNLRRETYTADSRNPQVEFGTPREDALRRDATVNALFYNLHTGCVEDFTGGLADMRAGLIRTPLPPLQTFTDDPLRVLRLVRFASRLQFRLDPAAAAAMAKEEVLQALRLKISRERVGTEVEKMLKDEHARDALGLLHRLGLYHAIFTDPTATEAETETTATLEPRLDGWEAVYDCLAGLAGKAMIPGSIYDVLVRTKEARYVAWVLAAIVPWELCEPALGPRPGQGSGGKAAPPPAVVALREGIRAPNKVCDIVKGAHMHRAEILALKAGVLGAAPWMGERDRFGMAIRAWEARGSNWKLQVLYALLYEVLQLARADRAEGKETRAAWDQTLEGVLREWHVFLEHLEKLDVLDAPHIKRLLDGKQVAAALGIKPGRWMTAAMDVCMAWQLRHPQETDPTGAIEEVRRRREELGIAQLLA